MEFLQWMFQDFPHFLGMIVLISIVGTLINGFVRAIQGRKDDDE
jgi:hypothetical protein